MPYVVKLFETPVLLSMDGRTDGRTYRRRANTIRQAKHSDAKLNCIHSTLQRLNYNLSACSLMLICGGVYPTLPYGETDFNITYKEDYTNHAVILT